MNRRSFLKTTAAVSAAALLCPSLLIQPQRRRTIDLRAFCGDAEAPDNAKYCLKHPFEQEGLVYATDARICVRVDPVSADTTLGEIRLPRASALPWWDHNRRGGWKTMPTHPEIIDPQDDYEPIVLFGGQYFDQQFWQRIATLGPMEMSVPTDAELQKYGKPLNQQPTRFIFDGGTGVIMPLDPDGTLRRIEYLRHKQAHRKLFPAS